MALHPARTARPAGRRRLASFQRLGRRIREIPQTAVSQFLHDAHTRERNAVLLQPRDLIVAALVPTDRAAISDDAPPRHSFPTNLSLLH